MGATPVTDFFRAIYLQADQEQRVELVNNYLQLLWRAGLKAGLSRATPAMQHLDGVLGSWWTWRQQYHDAVLRRWVPFTRAWDNELDQWAEKVSALQTELDEATSGAVSATLATNGLDSSMVAPDAGASAVHAVVQRTNDLLRSSWFWPVVGTVGALILAGVALKLYRNVKTEFV